MPASQVFCPTTNPRNHREVREPSKEHFHCLMAWKTKNEGVSSMGTLTVARAKARQSGSLTARSLRNRGSVGRDGNVDSSSKEESNEVPPDYRSGTVRPSGL